MKKLICKIFGHKRGNLMFGFGIVRRYSDDKVIATHETPLREYCQRCGKLLNSEKK